MANRRRHTRIIAALTRMAAMMKIQRSPRVRTFLCLRRVQKTMMRTTKREKAASWKARPLRRSALALSSSFCVSAPEESGRSQEFPCAARGNIGHSPPSAPPPAAWRTRAKMSDETKIQPIHLGLNGASWGATWSMTERVRDQQQARLEGWPRQRRTPGHDDVVL